MKTLPTILLLSAALLCVSVRARSQDAHISVDAAQVVNRITPWMYGACLEDVNHEVYGGLYDQKIFGESFEEPPGAAKFEGWTAYGGDWGTEGEAAHVDADAGGKLVRDAPDFADGSIEAEIKLSDAKGDNAGLLVRLANPGVGADNFDGYEVSLSASRQRLILGKHRHDFLPLREAPTTITPEQWQRLRVTLDGPRIRVFVNDGLTPLIDFTDPDRPLLSGRMALRTWNADAQFRNVRVQAGQTVAVAPFKAAGGESVSGMWDAIHTGRASSSFQRDADRPFNGAFCQKIQHGAGIGLVGAANRGLNRWGIAVKQGETLQGRIYLRALDLHGPVTLALQSADGEATYATQIVQRVGKGWAKYAFRLTPRTDDTHARFAVWIDRPGALWVDQAVLMGTSGEQFHGLPIRADIARALAAQGVTFLRYGGTMVNVPGYRWKNMVGDPDKRPPYKGNWYPYATNGFGIVDFLNFCEAAKIEPAFAINTEETAPDAAAMAEYLNGAVTTPQGRLRAKNGHPKPYHVRWIEIGNEEVIGGDDAAAYAHYVARFSALSDAIHAKAPEIQLVCAAWWRPESVNVERVFKALNGKAAFWDLHVWADDARAGADVDRQLTQMQALFQKWAPGTPIKCVIFEENGGLHNQQRALGHATVLNATRRHGDFVQVDCPANALQPWRQNDNGWDQGQLFFTPGRVWAMPPYYAQQMASLNRLPLRVQSVCEGSADLDVTATRSEDGKTLAIHVVNTGAVAHRVAVFLSNVPPALSSAQVWTLAGDLNAVNPPDGPETVHPQQSVMSNAGATFAHIFPAHSYTILRFQQKSLKEGEGFGYGAGKYARQDRLREGILTTWQMPGMRTSSPVRPTGPGTAASRLASASSAPEGSRRRSTCPRTRNCRTKGA